MSAHYSLFFPLSPPSSIHYSLFTIHYPPFTILYSLFSIHYSLFAYSRKILFDLGMVEMLPVAKLITGTSLGNKAMIVAAVADVKEGATIIIPADDSNETRALLLLEQEELIAQTQLTA